MSLLLTLKNFNLISKLKICFCDINIDLVNFIIMLIIFINVSLSFDRDPDNFSTYIFVSLFL